MSCSEIEMKKLFSGEGNAQLKKIYEADSEGWIDTIFLYEIRTVTWYSLNPVAFPASLEGVGNNALSKCDYRIPKGFEYLINSFLEMRPPAIKVKDEFSADTRIAWTNNLLGETVTDASCVIDDSIHLQGIDKHWIIMNNEFYTDPGHERRSDLSIGNYSDMIEMDTILPSRELSCRQPWFYSMKSGSAFPLFILNSNSTISHKYQYELDIVNLLQMEILENDKWVKVKPMISRLDGVPSNGMLPMPVLRGTFGKIRESEVSWNRSERGDYQIFTEDVIKCDGEGTIQCGGQQSIALKSEGMCKAIFWGAYNVTQHKLNNRSNYTTNSNDPIDGDPPIRKVSMRYAGGCDKFNGIPIESFAGPLLRDHFPKAPRRNGLYAFSFSYESHFYGSDVGVDLEAVGATLKCEIADPDTVKWKNGNIDVRGDAANQADRCRDEFQLVVRLLTMHNYTFNESGNIVQVF